MLAIRFRLYRSSRVRNEYLLPRFLSIVDGEFRSATRAVPYREDSVTLIDHDDVPL